MANGRMISDAPDKPHMIGLNKPILFFMNIIITYIYIDISIAEILYFISRVAENEMPKTKNALQIFLMSIGC